MEIQIQKGFELKKIIWFLNPQGKLSFLIKESHKSEQIPLGNSLLLLGFWNIVRDFLFALK